MPAKFQRMEMATLLEQSWTTVSSSTSPFNCFVIAAVPAFILQIKKNNKNNVMETQLMSESCLITNHPDLCPQELDSFFLNQPLQSLLFIVLLQPGNKSSCHFSQFKCTTKTKQKQFISLYTSNCSMLSFIFKETVDVGISIFFLEKSKMFRDVTCRTCPSKRGCGLASGAGGFHRAPLWPVGDNNVRVAPSTTTGFSPLPRLPQLDSVH